MIAMLEFIVSFIQRRKPKHTEITTK